MVKSICRHCHGNKGIPLFEWDYYDDKRWREGRVSCLQLKEPVGIYDFGRHAILRRYPQSGTGLPAHSNCPWALEHLLLPDEKDVWVTE